MHYRVARPMPPQPTSAIPGVSFFEVGDFGSAARRIRR
jgi:hypothetical protein